MCASRGSLEGVNSTATRLKKPHEPKPLKPLREVAFALLARAEQTASQLRTKLLRKGYDRYEINVLIDELKIRDYINDARAAKLLVQRRAVGSKWGAAKIKQELAQKGIDKELGQTTLAGLEEGEEALGQPGHDWLAVATQLLRSKYKQPLPTERAAMQKEQARRLGFLLRRGFSSQQALAALKATTGVAAED
jgi:regulatory protein